MMGVESTSSILKVHYLKNWTRTTIHLIPKVEHWLSLRLSGNFFIILSMHVMHSEETRLLYLCCLCGNEKLIMIMHF